MSTLTPDQVMGYWVQAGGAAMHSELAMWVATAESSRNPQAVSPDGGYGLWQIQASVWAKHFGVTRQQLLDPRINARAAVEISKAGSNWAAWCTMWADPARDCGHGWISAPQPGSAVWRAMGRPVGHPKYLPPGQRSELAQVTSWMSDEWNVIRNWYSGGRTENRKALYAVIDNIRRRRW